MPRTKLPEVLRRIRDLEARSGLRDRQRLSCRRRQPASAHLLRRGDSRPGGARRAGRVRDPAVLHRGRRRDHGRTRRRRGQEGVHAEDVRRRRPRHDAARAMRVRSDRHLQSRQGLSDAAALRRSARARIASTRSSAPGWRSASRWRRRLLEPARRRRRRRDADMRPPATGPVGDVRGAGTKLRRARRRGDVVLSTPKLNAADRSRRRRPRRDGAGRRVARRRQRRAARERQWLPLDPPRRPSRHHRRHHRDQRQRTAAASVRRAARSHHRHRDRARRRTDRQGRRPRRQERRRLRPVEADVRIARHAGRRHERDVQAVAGRAVLADGRRDVRDLRSSSASSALAIANAPVDAVGHRAPVAAASAARPVRDDRRRGRRRWTAAADLCASTARRSTSSDRTGRNVDAWRAHESRIFSAAGAVVKIAVLPTDVSAISVARCSALTAAQRRSSTPSPDAPRSASFFVRIGGDAVAAGVDSGRAPPRRDVPARQRGVLLSAPPEVKAQLGTWGPLGDAEPIMRAVKARFDPHGMLNAGCAPWDSGRHEQRRAARNGIRSRSRRSSR